MSIINVYYRFFAPHNSMKSGLLFQILIISYYSY